jgi:hypothetical protein
MSKAGLLRVGLDPLKITRPSELVDAPEEEPPFTRVIMRYLNREIRKDFRRGFEGDRIVDWAEKSWGVRSESTAITFNGKDWTPSNFLPQDCVIDFVPRWKESSEEAPPLEESSNETQVFVSILDQERLWKLSRGNEWNSFKSRMDEIADNTEWSASFDGQIWNDDSRIPSRNTKIMVNFNLPGGSPKVKLPVTHITVRIQDKDPFPLTVVRNKEWVNFEKCMNLVLQGWHWKAILRGQPWENDDRKPCENDEIQILLEKCGPKLETVQVFVRVGSGGSQIVHLHKGREWEHFKEWMAAKCPLVRWSATVNGHTWEDNSFAPSRDQTIFVHVSGLAGGKNSNKLTVRIKIGDLPTKITHLIWNVQDCWDDLRSKINGELGHENWTAVVYGPRHQDGEDWADNSFRPDKMDEVRITIAPGAVAPAIPGAPSKAGQSKTSLPPPPPAK